MMVSSLQERERDRCRAAGVPMRHTGYRRKGVATTTGTDLQSLTKSSSRAQPFACKCCDCHRHSWTFPLFGHREREKERVCVSAGQKCSRSPYSLTGHRHGSNFLAARTASRLALLWQTGGPSDVVRTSKSLHRQLKVAAACPPTSLFDHRPSQTPVLSFPWSPLHV